MKSKITFFPLGNGDTTLIQLLDSGKSILWDYANLKTVDANDKRCDLPSELNNRVKGDFDVVCFTHADKDHIYKMSEYFYLEHAKKYQEGSRKKIKELWVPAAILIDGESNNDDDNILKAEARYRMKKGVGIKVFSRPDKLKEWLEKNEINFESVKHLIIDAGTLVPGWDKNKDGVEFFIHSPFMGHVDESTVVDRNLSGILAQVVFGNAKDTKLILGADGHCITWESIVKITRLKKNDHRLIWDIFHIPHHCSYTAIHESEKGEKKTNPGGLIRWLYETQAKDKCLMVIPSFELEMEDTSQPPHFQAYN